jgi:hypothetical protein
MKRKLLRGLALALMLPAVILTHIVFWGCLSRLLG